MNTIQIRTRLESESPHLPELKPFIGRNVKITVEELPSDVPEARKVDWDEVFAAVDRIIERGTYDYDALKRQDEIDIKDAEDMWR